jgi:hypothetical protein
VTQLQDTRTCKTEEVPKLVMSAACVLASLPAQCPSKDAKQGFLVFCFFSRIFHGAYTYENLTLTGGLG